MMLAEQLVCRVRFLGGGSVAYALHDRPDLAMAADLIRRFTSLYFVHGSSMVNYTYADLGLVLQMATWPAQLQQTLLACQ